MKLNSIEEALKFNRESGDRRKELSLDYKWMIPLDEYNWDETKAYFMYDGSLPQGYRIEGIMEDGLQGVMNPFNLIIYNVMLIEDNEIIRRYTWHDDREAFVRVLW